MGLKRGSWSMMMFNFTSPISEWELRTLILKHLIHLCLMQVGIFLMNSMNLTWGLVCDRSRCFWMITRRCHLMLWPTWQVFMGGGFEVPFDALTYLTGIYGRRFWQPQTSTIMLHLPAPLLPAPFIYSLMPSTNIELLLMLVTMLDIIKQKNNIPKNQD